MCTYTGKHRLHIITYITNFEQKSDDEYVVGLYPHSVLMTDITHHNIKQNKQV